MDRTSLISMSQLALTNPRPTFFDASGGGRSLGLVAMVSVASVPEPSTLALLAAGLLGLTYRRRVTT
jgi:hypothetical protein